MENTAVIAEGIGWDYKGLVQRSFGGDITVLYSNCGGKNTDLYMN